MDLAEIKLYLRVDSDDDDGLLESLKNSAMIFLKSAGVKEDEGNPLYCTAVKMLVSSLYDDRGLGGATQSSMFNIILVQLTR